MKVHKELNNMFQEIDKTNVNSGDIRDYRPLEHFGNV